MYMYMVMHNDTAIMKHIMSKMVYTLVLDSHYTTQIVQEHMLLNHLMSLLFPVAVRKRGCT